MSNQPIANASTHSPPNSPDDRALVRAARSDALAFAALYERYVTRVYRFSCDQMERMVASIQ